MSKESTVKWCETYLTKWGSGARPLGWKWKTDPVTSEQILYCGTQVVREKDCQLKFKGNSNE